MLLSETGPLEKEMTNNYAAQGPLIKRRKVLSGATICAFACLLPGKLLSAMTKPGTKGDAGTVQGGTNLYAFRGAGTKGTTVIALTWPVPSFCCGESERPISVVRIHCGTRQWDVKALEGLVEPAIWEEKGCRMFAGNALSNGPTFSAVLIEFRTEMQSDDELGGIWAERFTSDGQRHRTGSPFLARILAANPSLAKLYHRSSPADDKSELVEQVAAAIAGNAREQGTLADPEAHGRRLAQVLMPDVLRYDPNRPCGFTFAGQNGRHPHEASELIVDSILTGALLVFPAHPAFHLQDEFPYFTQTF